jgi:hypothetical protein
VASRHQLLSEVRSTLLVACRLQRLNNEEGIDDAERKKEPRPTSLGQLPREMVRMLLLCLGSHRRPPSPPDTVPWKQLNNGDDGLPADWRSCLPLQP